MTQYDIVVLRDLAKHYMDICRHPVQDRRRDLWRRHNSLKTTRPLIYVRAFAWREMQQSLCIISDPFLRQYENMFRHRLFWNSLNDDSVFEPWVTVQATRLCTGWGPPVTRSFSGEPRGSFKIDYAIKALSDIEALQVPWHAIDEEKTIADISRLEDAIGDIITVNLDRGPAYTMWDADISTQLGYLRGMEHFMMDMVDHPEWLKRLIQFIADGVVMTHEEAEQAGGLGPVRASEPSHAICPGASGSCCQRQRRQTQRTVGVHGCPGVHRSVPGDA